MNAAILIALGVIVYLVFRFGGGDKTAVLFVAVPMFVIYFVGRGCSMPWFTDRPTEEITLDVVYETDGRVRWGGVLESADAMPMLGIAAAGASQQMTDAEGRTCSTSTREPNCFWVGPRGHLRVPVRGNETVIRLTVREWTGLYWRDVDTVTVPIEPQLFVDPRPDLRGETGEGYIRPTAGGRLHAVARGHRVL